MATKKSKIDALADTFPIQDEDEEEISFPTLKELKIHDPLLGCPMTFVNRQTREEVQIEPGQWMWDEVQIEFEAVMGRPLINRDTGLPFNIPVQALGMNGLNSYFISTLGQVVELKGSSGKGDYEALFAGRTRLLAWLFPRWSAPKKDKPAAIVGWEADKCKTALTDWAGECGVFKEEEALRGRGMWRDGRGGIVLHTGDAIHIGGQWRPPGRYGGHIYPALPPVGKPKKHGDLYATAGRVTLEILQTWNWERDIIDPRFCLGWIMTAKMGAVLFRRPVIWITGAGGAGKSFLQAFMRELFNRGLVAASNATQASIYQKIGNDCLPVMLDEQESKDDNRGTDKILELIRAAYTGDDLLRGGKEGAAKTFTLRSSFMASSISKPPTESQDDSRMATLMLRPIENISADAPYTAEQASKLGQALTRRAMDWALRWDHLLNMFEVALRKHKGHTSRSIDTFATLAAGCHVAMFDEFPTEAQLEQWSQLLAPEGMAELQNQKDSWEKCMRWMLMATCETWKHNRNRRTLGAMLAHYWHVNTVKGIALDDIEDDLKHTRIRVNFKKGDPKEPAYARLFIPNSDPLVRELLEGTPWQGKAASDGPWSGVLKQAPKHIWESSFCTKGGLGGGRGLSFHLKGLIEVLGIQNDFDEYVPAGDPDGEFNPDDFEVK